VLLASEQGLTLTTYFSLLMAAIIIVNTFFMNVTERRRHLSIMRAVGATKRQITLSLLGEGLLLGVVGTIIGMGLGVLTAFVVTYVLATSFQVQLPRLVEVMTPKPFIIGAAFGLGMALLGTAVPAIIAGMVSPLEGMNRSTGERKGNMTRLFFVVGSLLTLGSAGVIAGSIAGVLPMDMATFAAITLLVGLVVLDAVVLAPQAAAVAWLIKPLGRVETALALKQVLRHHTRSALTVAVLFIVGSTGVGMANSILDNVHDVYEWFDQAILGDYFLRAMMPDLATGTAADLPEELGDDLKQVQERYNRNIPSDDKVVVEGASFVEAKVPLPNSDMLTAIVIARGYEDPDPPAFDLLPGAGDRSKLREQLRSGQVVVGSVLAQKMGLKVGDKLPIETQEGVQHVPICAIANEYLVGGLAVHMYRDLAARWLGVQGVDGYVVKAPEHLLDPLRPELEAIAKKYDVILLSRVDIRRNIDGIVNGAAWSLWALVYIGFIVAAFGVVNTLTMNVLEQTRELGLLRIVAMTKRQVWRTIVKQAIIIGGVGLPPGIAVGVIIAYVLNLAMMPSFGHPVDFHIHKWMVFGTLVGAFATVLVAAIIPARRATQVNVVEALHYE
jgi:putative ABC transport system permease protein